MVEQTIALFFFATVGSNWVGLEQASSLWHRWLSAGEQALQLMAAGAIIGQPDQKSNGQSGNDSFRRGRSLVAIRGRIIPWFQLFGQKTGESISVVRPT